MLHRKALELFKESKDICFIMAVVERLSLPELCLTAGTLRNYLWDRLSGHEGVLRSDVDLVYYNPDSSYEEALLVEKHLQEKYPQYHWEVRNQAFMHQHNAPNEKAFQSVFDAIAHYPEKCTSLALYVEQKGWKLFAPYGLEDVFRFEIHPTPYFASREDLFQIYLKRQSEKKWQKIWPQIKIYGKENTDV